MNNSISSLTTQAIAASQSGDWNQGKSLNAQIIEQEPNNIPGLNRLAFCEMQLGNLAEARKIYGHVLELERCNSIALKYTNLLKQKVTFVPSPTIQREDFIEEPGKTKSLSLQKLADPDVLQSVAIATPCELVVKNHRVNVQTLDHKIYLGSLPDDIAFRLQRLIKAGNTYKVFVQSTTKKSCTVFIKETYRSPQALSAPSFPGNGGQGSPLLAEDILLDEAPLDTRETGSEEVEVEVEENDDMLE